MGGIKVSCDGVSGVYRLPTIGVTSLVCSLVGRSENPRNGKATGLYKQLDC